MYIVQNRQGTTWSYGSWISITANFLSSHPANDKVYSIQRYVINFVSDLRQVGGLLLFVRFPPPTILTVLYMTGSDVKHHNPNPKDVISKFNWGHHNNTVNNFNIHAFSLQVYLKILKAETHLLWIDVVHPAHWLMVRHALDHQLLTIVSMEDMKMHNTNDNISLNETIVYIPMIVTVIVISHFFPEIYPKIINSLPVGIHSNDN